NRARRFSSVSGSGGMMSSTALMPYTLRLNRAFALRLPDSGYHTNGQSARGRVTFSSSTDATINQRR
ncbi:MAG: hypothetical protein K8U57_25035, partial [Planctomycetes bacterium]|nr:hypothetical protein [Planctomycetota bacterium]